MSGVPRTPSGRTSLGAYELHEQVMSDLVSATHRATIARTAGDMGRNETVALRVVHDDLAGHARAVEGFLHANRRIADTDHPHLLRVVDVGTSDEGSYVATVWREGMPLSEMLLEHAPLPIRLVLRLGGQLAEALDTVHERGIVHGNVGLHTVWIKHRRHSRASAGAALTAFGSSHLLAAILRDLDERAAAVDLLFVAPEQLHGSPAGPRTDQYALACVLFTALTGTTPFRGDTNNALFGAHMFTAAPKATSVRGDLDSAWDDVFAKAFAKEPDERYENCRTLLLEAGRCAPAAGLEDEHRLTVPWSPRTATSGGGPVEAGRPREATGAPVSPRRRRFVRVALGLALALILLMLAVRWGGVALPGVTPLGAGGWLAAGTAVWRRESRGAHVLGWTRVGRRDATVPDVHPARTSSR